VAESVLGVHPADIVSPWYEGHKSTIRPDDPFIALRSAAQPAFTRALFACTLHLIHRTIALLVNGVCSTRFIGYNNQLGHESK
jgi:hypothetical protein